jgi:hypothetical protein
MNRRTAIQNAAALALAAAASPVAAQAGYAADAAAPPPRSASVRDRLWIFTAPEAANNELLELGGFRGGSRMTPAEGAFYLDVPNLIMVRCFDLPPHPGRDRGWRAKTHFEQYALSFRPLQRVLWSVVGAGGMGGAADAPEVVTLAKTFPNITGAFFDDLGLGNPAMSAEAIRGVRKTLGTVGRPMEMWVTLYTHEINTARKDPGAAGNARELLSCFDVLTLWTWNSDELRAIEENMAALESLAPKETRKALGLYIYDYHNKKPVPLDLMKHQCELGLRWLKAGRVSNLILLGNTVLDLDFESAEFARQWIARVGPERLPVPHD